MGWVVGSDGVVGRFMLWMCGWWGGWLEGSWVGGCVAVWVVVGWVVQGFMGGCIYFTTHEQLQC